MLRLAPQLPSCADCKRWLFDLRTGRRTERGGKPVPRLVNVPTPCRDCPKVPAGAPPVPESAVELTPANLLCLAHYQGCRATGHWPDDERVKRNAALIRAVDDAVEQARAAAPEKLLALLAQSLGVAR